MRKIVIIRKGECKMCGYCCRGNNCPHKDGDLCAIHETQADYCELCGQDHKECIDAPTFPMRKWNPDCGFRFYVQGEGLEVVAMECCAIKE